MEVVTRELSISTEGENDIRDITGMVERELKGSGLRNGVVVIFVPGSTASVSTMEYEPGLKKDIPASLERIAPYHADYEHHKTWGDYNGSAHVRASLIGPGLVVPFVDGRLVLGTWQQIALLDFDTRPRKRRLVLQILGAR